MKDHMTVSPQGQAGYHRHGLRLDQAVELQRGALTGMSGVLVGFRGDRRCQIELDDVPQGVFLIVDCAAVKGQAVRQFE